MMMIFVCTSLRSTVPVSGTGNTKRVNGRRRCVECFFFYISETSTSSLETLTICGGAISENDLRRAAPHITTCPCRRARTT